MKNIEGRLNAMERKIKTNNSNYCTTHAREPIIVFKKDKKPEIPSNCPKCGKPFSPNCPPVIISFTDFGIDENWG